MDSTSLSTLHMLHSSCSRWYTRFLAPRRKEKFVETFLREDICGINTYMLLSKEKVKKKQTKHKSLCNLVLQPTLTLGRSSKDPNPNSWLCVQWPIQNLCVCFSLTALTEHQLQLTCFEKPKLPYPLRRYLLTQHGKPGACVGDWHVTAAAAKLQTTFIPISTHMYPDQEMWQTTMDLIVCDVCCK